jgi:hypothetical protein
VAPSPPEYLAAEAERRSGRRASGSAEESGVATSRFGEAEERRAAARSREGAFGRGQVREGKKVSSQFSYFIEESETKSNSNRMEYLPPLKCYSESGHPYNDIKVKYLRKKDKRATSQ